MIRLAALALAVSAASPALCGAEIVFVAEDVRFAAKATDASQSADGSKSAIYVRLDASQSDAFATFTAAAIGTPVSVFVCDQEVMRPVVQSAITTPALVIGAPTVEAAASLVTVLTTPASCDGFVWED